MTPLSSSFQSKQISSPAELRSLVLHKHSLRGSGYCDHFGGLPRFTSLGSSDQLDLLSFSWLVLFQHQGLQLIISLGASLSAKKHEDDSYELVRSSRSSEPRNPTEMKI